jgi:hypothetical protein
MTIVDRAMNDRFTNEHAAHKRPVAKSHPRFTLRTLFFVSVALAVPFLLIANLRNAARPDDSLASPLYMLFGVAAMLIAAAIGKALAHTPGMLINAGIAGVAWISLVVLLSDFSAMLARQLPVHVVAVIATMVGLAAVVHWRRESNDDTLHEHLVRLLKVKSSLHDAEKTEPAPNAWTNSEGESRAK